MSSYFILWPNDWCTLLEKARNTDVLQVIYGGEHTSVPPLGKVTVGDTVYPVRVKQGVLFVLGRMQIEHIDDADAYTAAQSIFRPKGMLWDTASGILIKEHPEWGHRIPRNCVDHAATGNGTALHFDCGIPLEIVSALQLGQPGKEKPLPLKEGKVSHVNLQGHFRRLSDGSAQTFANWFVRQFNNN